MAKDTFYFSHDYNARTDAKVKRLIAKHGMLGYGVFWGIVEDLYNNANALPTDYESIAFDLRTDSEVVKSVVCDFDLFVFEDGHFGSISIERRLEERNNKSIKARESALKRWSKCERIANAEPTHSEGNAIKERKVKESKGNKIKGYLPTLDEVKFYCIERKNGVDAEKWMNHYTANGWMIGKNKMRDWRAAVRTWEAKKITQPEKVTRDDSW